MIERRRSERGPRRAATYVVLALGLAALAFPLASLGWRSSAALHTNVELLATCGAAVVAVLALARYYSRPNNAFLFLGTGFLGTAFLDGYHAVVTSAGVSPRLPSALSSLIPWSWVASRLFLSVLMCVGFHYARREAGSDREPIDRRVVYATVAGLTLATFVLFAFVPLPPAYYSDLFLHRPEELVPALFFGVAAVWYYREGRWRNDTFTHWLMLSLIVGAASQTFYMPFSEELFDPWFDMAHTLKLASYGCLFTGLVHDIYVSFRNEAQRAAKLEQMVDERTGQLQERSADLERSNKDLDDFAYVASHDLKAPLRDVDNLATWILEDVGDDLPPASRAHLDTMRQRLNRMERLLEDLLIYSRAGRVFQSPDEVDLQPLIEDVASFVTASRPGFEVTVRMDGIRTIRTPKAPLEVILRNLVGNAVKHHDREHGSIVVSAEASGRFVVLTVADDGPGIAAEFHERVFGAFQTLQPRDEVEGTGMGLALVRKLVEAHGGVIELDSAEGRGASFRFTWPKTWDR